MCQTQIKSPEAVQHDGVVEKLERKGSLGRMVLEGAFSQATIVVPSNYPSASVQSQAARGMSSSTPSFVHVSIADDNAQGEGQGIVPNVLKADTILSSATPPPSPPPGTTTKPPLQEPRALVTTPVSPGQQRRVSITQSLDFANTMKREPHQKWVLYNSTGASTSESGHLNRRFTFAVADVPSPSSRRADRPTSRHLDLAESEALATQIKRISQRQQQEVHASSGCSSIDGQNGAAASVVNPLVKNRRLRSSMRGHNSKHQDDALSDFEKFRGFPLNTFTKGPLFGQPHRELVPSACVSHLKSPLSIEVHGFVVCKKDTFVSRENMLVPSVFKLMLDFIEANGLQTEGIFRISADPDDVSVLKAQLQILHNRQVAMIRDQSQWPTDDAVNLIGVPLLQTEGWNKLSHIVHAVSSVLKYFLKQLPDPILTSSLQNLLLKQTELYLLQDTLAGDDRMANHVRWCSIVSHAISGTFSQLPPSEQTILKMLLRLLHTVQRNAGVNKMTSKNLAIVFAPTLFRESIALDATALSRGVNFNTEDGVTSSMGNLDTSIVCIEGLVDHFEALFNEFVLPDCPTNESTFLARGSSNMNEVGKCLSDSVKKNMQVESVTCLLMKFDL
jgi:hypothetical protein